MESVKNDPTKIPYALPSITPTEIASVEYEIAHGWGENCNRAVEGFEREFARKIGVKYAIATSSCTGAMHLGMLALSQVDKWNKKKKKSVIVGDINWIATVAPALHMGLKLSLVDVKVDTWCIDRDQIAQSLQYDPVALIATHLYGNMCDMDALLEFGERHDIPVIEDAAEAIGGQYKGKHAGSMGRFGVFSFHGTKTITTGEGGMFVTNDENLYEVALTISNHGRKKGETKLFYPVMLGVKYKMGNLQAALGLAQLSRWDELVEDRRMVFGQYHSRLKECPIVEAMNPPRDEVYNHAYWMPTVVFDELKSRMSVIKEFDKRNIDARPFFAPLHCFDFVKSKMVHKRLYGTYHYCVSGLWFRSLNLPSYYGISERDIDRVCEVIWDRVNDRG